MRNICRDQSPRRSLMNKIRRLCAFLAVALVAGCSSSADVATARMGIARFRELMEAQQFHQIYEEASDELKKKTQEQQFVRVLTAFRGKLGGVRVTEDNAMRVTFRPSGTLVELAFKTEFERGSGIETFAYNVVQGSAWLVGYRVDSADLVTN
jgi:hypothetical protein